MSKFRRGGFYNVRPRFTAGSPAMVDQATAELVVEQEKTAYGHALEGAYGDKDLERARSSGLHGIVEYAVERRGGWDVEDLITGRKTRREHVVATKLLAGDVVYRGWDSKGQDASGTKIIHPPQVGAGLVLICHDANAGGSRPLTHSDFTTLWKTEIVIVEREVKS